MQYLVTPRVLAATLMAPLLSMLFVCVANSGRSVMAERLFRRDVHGRHEARSAGSNPGDAAHPQVTS